MNILTTPNQRTKAVKRSLKRQQGEPVWELAHLFPGQGEWTEEKYLSLETNLLIEYSDGYLEVLPMPTMLHQDIVAYLFEILVAFARKTKAGSVYFAPLPVRLWRKKYREPDIVFLSSTRPERKKGKHPHGADLVMEVVSDSPEDRERDYKEKREEYAQASISEYWIVDPPKKRITVLHLVEKTYAVHGEFEAGTQATSVLLPGFSVNVTDVFNVEQQ